MFVRHRQIVLPVAIAGIGLRTAFHDGEARRIRGQGGRQLALRHLQAANSIVRARQIALPVGIAGVQPRQAVRDSLFRLIGGQRSRQIALRLLCVADPLVRHRQIVLSADAGWLLHQ